jgi:glycosyltransferase involved in cell wall biosynthesis
MINQQTNNTIKVAYLHGRPGPHPMHRKFAEVTGAEFHFVDFKMRWQDKKKSIVYRFMSSIVCAFTFPERKKYNIFLIDNLHFMPVLMKIFGLLRKDQKIVAHMGSHTLFFLYSHRFSKLTEWLHVQALKRYDALICEGKMAENLAKLILGSKHPKLYYVFMGIPKEHYPSQENILPITKEKNILFMGNGPDDNRLWYKGLDIMIKAVNLTLKTDSDITFTIVGDWNKTVINKLLLKQDQKTREAIHFVGHADNLEKYTRNASLYLHCARGEAFGITILIAMATGIPALVSEWTGAKEVVEQVDSRFIVPLDSSLIAERITWYFNLPFSERALLSKKNRQVAVNYTEENSVTDFKKVFETMTKDFNQGNGSR